MPRPQKNTAEHNLALSLGRVVRRARVKRGRTCMELCTIAELRYDTLVYVEKGYTVPTLHTLQRIAGALDTSAWNLLRNAEEQLKAETTPEAAHG